MINCSVCSYYRLNALPMKALHNEHNYVAASNAYYNKYPLLHNNRTLYLNSQKWAVGAATLIMVFLSTRPQYRSAAL